MANLDGTPEGAGQMCDEVSVNSLGARQEGGADLRRYDKHNDQHREFPPLA
jgi:hypothetical protein